MIASKCFTKDYILEQKTAFGPCDPGLIEKAIYALALLGNSL